MRGLDVGALERRVRSANADVVFASSSVLARVIKRHRGLASLGLHVPHGRCYTLSRTELFAVVDETDLGVTVASLPEHVIVVLRPPGRELDGAAPDDVLTEMWRAVFHARVHLALEGRGGEGQLSEAAIRARIDHLGQIEFDEIRGVLAHDDHVLAPHDDREAFVEFAALYLEYLHFSPAMLGPLFPSLAGGGRVEALLARDIDAAALLQGCRPDGMRAGPVSFAVAGAPSASSASAPPSDPPSAPASRSTAAFSAQLAAADAAHAKGNVVRALLLRIGARDVAPASDEAAARDGVAAECSALSKRFAAALGEDADPAACASDAVLFQCLGERARGHRGVRRTVEVRMLYDVQRACTANERTFRTVDLVEWALSFGTRPIVRTLPATREVRILRHVRAARAKAATARLAPRSHAALAKRLHHAEERAEANVGSALRPQILETLAAVGLRAASVPERVSLDKLADELVEHVGHRGYLNLGQLRDAVSRNQLKIEDLAGPLELVTGDALLDADRRLSVALDGVHRRGEIHLRFLQKCSSLLFGTAPGRFFTLYFALPGGVAFVFLEGASHLATALARRPHGEHVHLLNGPSFAITAAFVFALIHSPAFRAGVLRAVSLVGHAFRAVFVDLPAWIAARPMFTAMVANPIVRGAVRYTLKPFTVIAALYLAPVFLLHRQPSVAVAFALFLVANLSVNSKIGTRIEELAVDWLVQQWRFVSRRVLPGLWSLITAAFRGWVEMLDRAIYAVDEFLRFREGEHVAVLGPKAVLGVAWFAVAYMLRFSMNLFIEPQVNPIKHFPVVTVSHKMMLPFDASLDHAVYAVLAPFGHVVAHAVAATTVLLFPGVFGFLVWELKENWKLYRASRPDALLPVPVGHHGETVAVLLKPGFHSGTLPKLYAKLRSAARKKGVHLALARHEQALAEVRKAVTDFVTREFSALLAATPRWVHGPVRVRSVDLASNRIRVHLSCSALSQEACRIAFEEQSGYLVAGVVRAGWVDALAGEDRLLVENALAGLYHLAGVDIVREQVAAALVGSPAYDISDEGLVVWPDGDYGAEVVYDLRQVGTLHAKVRGGAGIAAASIEANAVLFGQQPVAWATWVAAWGGDSVARVLPGASILPAPARAPLDGASNAAL